MRRHLVEEELQDSTLRFSQLAQQNLTVTWEVDAEGLFTYVSPVAETVFGYHPDELIGKLHFYDLHPEEGRGEFKEAALAEFKRKKEFENPIMIKNGKVVWVLTNTLPILTEEGDLKGYRGWGKDITEQKRSEEALIRSERELKKVQQITHIGSWYLDVATNQVVWTEELYKMYGFDPSLPPPPYTEHQKLFTPESWEALSAALTKTRDTGIPYELELELETVREYGMNRWMWVRGEAVLDKGGKIVGLWGAAQDITERKQSESALRNSEEKYRVLVNNLSSGVVVHAPDSSVMFSNPMASALLGLTKDQMRGKEAMDPAWNFLRENGTPMPLEEYPANQVLLSGNSIANQVLAIRRPDLPEPVWVQCNAYPYTAADGTLLQVVVAFTDITERKQIEEVQSYLLQISSLNTGEDFFESLARYLTTILGMDYVCIDTLHGDCLSARTLAIYCDGKFEDNVEYTLKDTPCGDVVGKDICVFPREVRSLFPQNEALQDLQAESYVGTTLWSYDMRPIGLIAVIGRKELNSSHFAESVLKLVSVRAAGELERRQVEEEKLLLQQQFQQTQKLESLGVLAGGIAHDFNNILTIIMGYCSLTKMDYEDAETHIPEIEKAAERAAALCRQMLAYAGKTSLAQAQVNTWMLVDEMVTMLKTTIQKNIVIKAEFDTDIPTTTGDASQIRQVVMNLIINAAEAIGDAEGAIAVKLVKAEFKAEHTEKDHLGLIIPAGRYILFEVTDNGCGMDEETSRKIFEPFYTTKFTGRGLGMSAVLGIINAHNGALQLESHPGQGTTFKVYLPVQFSKSESEEAQQKASSAPWHGSGTILLAEDEEQVKSIAIILLQELGFTVLDAENGKEALELYQQNAADISLVITDMGMPVMNGYELLLQTETDQPASTDHYRQRFW
jgi:PAS domain S-box-containing protein